MPKRINVLYKFVIKIPIVFRKYYVRVRTYKTVKFGGKNVKLYSGWSKAKTVRTKK